MALIKCKECGNQVSDTAEKCPSCGAKVPKKTSKAAWAVAIIFAIFLFAPLFKEKGAGGPQGSSEARQLSPKEEAMKNIQLEGNWRKEGFGSVMEVDFLVRNKSKYNVKDIKVECTHTANSGTKIDSNERVIYEVFKANKNKSVKNFNMGFINSQVSGTSCAIKDLVVING